MPSRLYLVSLLPILMFTGTANAADTCKDYQTRSNAIFPKDSSITGKIADQIEATGKYFSTLYCKELKIARETFEKSQTMKTRTQSMIDDTNDTEEIATLKNALALNEAGLEAARVKIDNLETSENYLWIFNAKNTCKKSPAGKLQDAAACLQYLDDGLQSEIAWVNAAKGETVHLLTDRESLQMSLNSIERKLVLEETGTPFRTEDFAKLYSDDTYTATFHLGGTFMPEYDQSGNNQGFKEANFLGRFTLDNRAENVWGADALHTGVNVTFFSGHIVDCDNIPEAEPAEIAKCKTDKDEADLGSLNFNDISDTVHASAYTWWNWGFRGNEDVEWGPGLTATIQSRRELADNGDSLNAIYSAGLRVVRNDFQGKKNANGASAKNGLPVYFLEISAAHYESFATVEKYDDWRTVIRGAYRVMDNTPIYIGMVINAADGPDELALTLTYGLQVQKIIGLFQ